MFYEKLIKKNAPVYIIAEIGGNFRTFDEAKKMIDLAKKAGVDCVKLQTYKGETIANKNAFFDMENTGKISQQEYFKKFEISKELHKLVISYAKEQGLDWFSTPSHKDDVDMLLELGMDTIKIGADDAVNIPFLKYCAKTGLPIGLSTGLCTLDEIKLAVETIKNEGNDKIFLFHTVSIYPTHPKDANLLALKTLSDTFEGIPVGLSDHSQGTLAAICAAAMGAKIIERHFTYDKNADGPDHMLSSDYDEMKYIVDSIRTFEIMKGDGIKRPVGVEIQNRINNRKSIVTISDIKKGDVFSEKNIDIKRPGSGIEPKEYENIIGKIANNDIKADELLKKEDIIW